ncbi:MAG: hypothetical protein QW341_00545 [Candidatus Bathyarchaeia archaeon]
MRMMKPAALMLFLAMLVLAGDVLSSLISVDRIDALGGSGLINVGRGYVIVQGVGLYYGGSQASRFFNNVRLTMYVSDSSIAGTYEVTVVVDNGGAIYTVTQTVTLSTTASIYTFSLPTNIAQAGEVSITVYARRLD